jgi:hypothetical protein
VSWRQLLPEFARVGSETPRLIAVRLRPPQRADNLKYGLPFRAVPETEDSSAWIGAGCRAALSSSSISTIDTLTVSSVTCSSRT